MLRRNDIFNGPRIRMFGLREDEVFPTLDFLEWRVQRAAARC